MDHQFSYIAVVEEGAGIFDSYYGETYLIKRKNGQSLGRVGRNMDEKFRFITFDDHRSFNSEELGDIRNFLIAINHGWAPNHDNGYKGDPHSQEE